MAVALVVLIGTSSAQAGPIDLVGTLLRALNTKDAELLTRIYGGYFPYRQCNQFEQMLAVAMIAPAKTYLGGGFALEDLLHSEATLTSEPREIETVSESGRVRIVFGLHWAFATSERSDEEDLIISWEAKEIVGEWKVVEQRASPCH